MGFQDSLNNMNESINNFFTFIAGRLKDFKNLSLGEQIAFPSAGLGLLLIIISLFMFILF